MVAMRAGVSLLFLTAVAVPAFAAAGGVTGAAAAYPVGSESYDVAPGPATTSTTTFSPLPGLDLIHIGSNGPATATFSATLSGADVDIRVLRDGRPLFPRTIHIGASVSGASVSYRFVAGRFVPGGCHRFAVQWRSPQGQPVTMQRGSLVVDYHGVHVTGGCGL
jgi:hypothetical protein